MLAIDTNVVARFLLNDDPAQADIARGIIEAGVLIPITVLLEIGWLLGSRYRQPRDKLAQALLEFLDLPGVHVEQVDAVAWAIERYAGGADWADMIHLVAASHASGFATFDHSIAEAAGPAAPVPVETLA